MKEMRSIANKEAADMKLAADYRALARDALRGRWKTAVLAGLLASALGANIVNATGNITEHQWKETNQLLEKIWDVCAYEL